MHSRWRFGDYIKENYVTEYFPEKQIMLKNIGWYKIEKLELQKWLNEFIEIEIKRQEEKERESMKGHQLDLF